MTSFSFILTPPSSSLFLLLHRLLHPCFSSFILVLPPSSPSSSSLLLHRLLHPRSSSFFILVLPSSPTSSSSFLLLHRLLHPQSFSFIVFLILTPPSLPFHPHSSSFITFCTAFCCIPFSVPSPHVPHSFYIPTSPSTFTSYLPPLNLSPLPPSAISPSVYSPPSPL